MTEKLTKEDFCVRFTAEFVRLVGPTFRQMDDDGPQEDEMSTAEYAAEVGPSYYENPDQRAEGPEECARIDYSYWE